MTNIESDVILRLLSIICNMQATKSSCQEAKGEHLRFEEASQICLSLAAL